MGREHPRKWYVSVTAIPSRAAPKGAGVAHNLIIEIAASQRAQGPSILIIIASQGMKKRTGAEEEADAHGRFLTQEPGMRIYVNDNTKDNARQ